MRSTVILLCLLLSAVLLRAQTVPKLQAEVSAGYEKQNLKWSIAGNSAGQNPNVYSELGWKKLGGSAISASLQWNFTGKFMLMGAYAHTAINSGKVTDNDYNGDNRTQMVYNQTFDADAGFNRDGRIGAGFVLINTDKFSLIPYVGYGTSKQSLHLLDRSGQFSTLNSTYVTNWKGPFLRAIASAKLVSRFKLIADITYNQANYNANADWNLISSFQHPVSYQHTAKGFGVEANAALSYSINRYLAINLGGGYFTWQTGKGVDELFLTTGSNEKTQLNGVDRKGYRLMGGVVFRY